MHLQFNSSGTIHGGLVVDYLLEKSRVSKVPQGERNYHVFYQLCSGAKEDLRSKLFLKEPSSYSILNQSSCMVIDKVNDAEELENTIQAMFNLDFTNNEVDVAFEIVAAVLHLGNILFEFDVVKEVEISRISKSSLDDLQNAAKLLQLETTGLGLQ